MAKRTAFMQALAVFAMMFVIIALCVTSTVYLKGSPAAVEAMGQRMSRVLGVNFYSPTMTDAQIACEKATKDNFGKRLRVFTVDSFSSRENLVDRIYQMYVDVELYELNDRKGPAWLYYIRCEVGADSGDVNVYTLIRSASPNAPAMGGENAFELVL